MDNNIFLLNVSVIQERIAFILDSIEIDHVAIPMLVDLNQELNTVCDLYAQWSSPKNII